MKIYVVYLTHKTEDLHQLECFSNIDVALAHEKQLGEAYPEKEWSIGFSERELDKQHTKIIR